ncbi:histone H1A, sperm-like [Topomyia yanbarensis]|uniref:histone H1A, sperm-like n=1 Tax=Topomyia yanbarensis TaxID=2498891 RepID=UPI00273CDA9D|nr:histone H1A, sperm-like [Topomyia yanbarensis]
MPETEAIKEAEAKLADADEPAPEKIKKKRGRKPAADGAPSKPKTKRNLDNPPVHDMIVEALDVLRDRKGTSLQAIKRYMEENFKIDSSKLSPFIRKALVNGVEDGRIIRTRGTGAFGRFKVKITKPAMIKKRQAPENYAELPMTNKRSRPNAPKKEKAAAAPIEKDASPKQKSTKPSKVETPKPSPKKGPKSKKGRKKN